MLVALVVVKGREGTPWFGSFLPWKPLLGLPSTFSTGTLTSSNVMYVVPLLHTPWQSIRRVLTPSLRSIRRRLTPPIPGPPVLTAVVK